MKKLILILSFVVGVLKILGCSSPLSLPKEKKDLFNLFKKNVLFETISPSDLQKFSKHDALDKLEAWYKAMPGEVIISTKNNAPWIRISGFPKDIGNPIATGWTENARFYINFSEGADMGIMLYCDLEKKQITEVREWGGW